MKKTLLVIAAGLLISNGISPTLSDETKQTRARSNAQSDTGKYAPKDLPPPLPAQDAKKEANRKRSNAQSDTGKYAPKDLPPPLPPQNAKKELPPKPVK